MSEVEQTPQEEVTGSTNRKEVSGAKNATLSLPKSEEFYSSTSSGVDINNELGNTPYLKESRETSLQPRDVVKTIDTKRHAIQIDEYKLNEVKKKYGISDWNVQVDPKFSFAPSVANWKTKTAIIRPFNFWSYLAVGSSVEKRNKVLPRLLAHELRHSQQKRPDGSLKGILLHIVRYGYWHDPIEIDAREWSLQHREEFEGIIRINRKL
jgi:hypothetical protein